MAGSVAMAAGIQTNIKIMSERLELEKRRLNKLEVELASARRAYEGRSLQHRRQRLAEARPVSASASRRGGGGDDGLVLPPAESRPKSGRGARVLSATHESMMSSASSSGGAPLVASPSPGGDGGALGASFGSRSRRPYESVSEYIARPPEPGYAKELLLPETGSWRTLLNRLDVSVKKLDVVRHDNQRLQTEVDQVRRQRLQLNAIFDRLKGEIRQRSAQLTDMNEETTAGLVVQSEAQQRIAVMQKQREKDRARFKEQVLSIRSNLKDYDFEKKEIEVKLKRAQDGVQKKRGLIMPPEESDFSETAMMRRIMKTAFLNCIQRRHIKQHEKIIAVFEQAFATIKQSTGISNIDEIVKIFIHLESKNYSLLTYVNHMNREIEALECIRQRRKAMEQGRVERDAKRDQTREATVGTMQRHLEAKEDLIRANRETCTTHRNLLNTLKPLLNRLGLCLQEEFDGLKKASGPLHNDFLPRLPAEIRDEGIPECLEWVEKALGRFRDLIKGHDREQVFPVTARARVAQLPAKKFTTAVYPLVNKNELPLCMLADDTQLQKRPNISAAQKADILDEEAEEEDFGDRPLSLKDIRDRAEKAISRRKRGRKHGGDATLTSTATTGQQLHTSESHNEQRSGRLGRQESEEEQSDRQATQDRDGEAFGGPSPDDGGVDGQGRRKRGDNLAGMQDNDANIGDEELDKAFLKRYRMSKEELQLMANRLGIHLSNLCFLKQEFDNFDADQSGYMDAAELKSLLKKLGEDLSEEDLAAAFQDLDADGSGEIEFFEFVEWFTSPD